MMAEERRIVREGARNWWILLVSGIAWLLIAWIVLRLDVTSVATVGVLICAVFIVAAVNEVTVASLIPGGWKIWHYVMGFIFFLGGLWGLITPIEILRARIRAGVDLGLLGGSSRSTGESSREVIRRTTSLRAPNHLPPVCFAFGDERGSPTGRDSL
jgi:hypothetical protein